MDHQGYPKIQKKLVTRYKKSKVYDCVLFFERKSRHSYKINKEEVNNTQIILESIFTTSQKYFVSKFTFNEHCFPTSI